MSRRSEAQPRQYGFSPRLTVINEKRQTNAQGLEYDRTRAELSFVKQF